jgi:hypothetical protein
MLEKACIPVSILPHQKNCNLIAAALISGKMELRSHTSSRTPTTFTHCDLADTALPTHKIISAISKFPVQHAILPFSPN